MFGKLPMHQTSTSEYPKYSRDSSSFIKEVNDGIGFHTPGANHQDVADHTFALILNVACKIIYCDRSLREKRWEHTKIMGL